MRLAVKLRQALLPIRRVSRGPSAPPLLGLSCLCPCLPQRSFPADAPRAAAPTRFPGRLACPRPGHNARTTVYPCGTGHGPKHPLPCTPLASGTPQSRAHPSNERCPSRLTRRQNGGSLRPHGASPRRRSALGLLGESLVSLFDPRLTPPPPAPWRHAAVPSSPPSDARP